MSVRGALRTACVDFYHQSWRLFLVNTAVSTVVAPLALAGAFAPPLLVLLVLTGPLVAALVHCTVVVARTEELRLRDAVLGLRLHWRRGLELAALLGAVALAGLTAVRFYAAAGPAGWPLTLAAVYLLALFALLQLPLWTLAVAERERSLAWVVRDSVVAVVRRPAGWAGLGAVLFLVNLAGAAAALAPLLTLTVAYSFLAAAHFLLPRRALPEVADG
jgi:hypothetical protein